ncbi:MAG: MATE family efflux transporter [Clostridiales bacterium]|nr:MATE family efflux transporter [Clostridiales bacterium]
MDTDLTRGNILRHLIDFTIPLILGNLFQLSYNMVDTIVIGRFAGSSALAAVGTCDQVMNLMVLGVSGLCIGASVLMGNFYGAGDREKLLEEMKTMTAIGLLFAVIVMAVGIPLTGVIFTLMRVRPEMMREATVYLRIIFAGMPFTCLYNIYSAALRSIGDSKTPIRFLVISCLINIALDLMLVVVFHMSVLGAALATVIAQACSAVLCIIYVGQRVPMLHIDWRGLRIDRSLARQTLSYGGMTALQQCSQPIGNIIIQSSVNALGVSAAAAFSAVRKIEDIGLLPGRSISTGITAFTAQNKGARDEARIQQGFRVGLRMELVVGMAMCAVVLLLRSPLMSLFTQDAAIIAAGVRYFDLIGFCYALPCLTNGIQGYFRGIGRMRVTLFATLTQISVRVIATLILSPVMGISGVGLACVLGWTAMIAWELPLQMHIRRVGVLDRHHTA